MEDKLAIKGVDEEENDEDDEGLIQKFGSIINPFKIFN